LTKTPASSAGNAYISVFLCIWHNGGAKFRLLT